MIRSAFDEVSACAVEGLQGVRAARRDGDLESLFAEHVRQRVAERLLVLYDEYSGHWGAARTVACSGLAFADAEVVESGRRMVKVEPEPSLLQTFTSPRWRLAACLTMARPSPVPPVCRDRAGSTR